MVNHLRSSLSFQHPLLRAEMKESDRKHDYLISLWLVKLGTCIGFDYRLISVVDGVMFVDGSPDPFNFHQDR
jgi:hypothetical protein